MANQAIGGPKGQVAASGQGTGPVQGKDDGKAPFNLRAVQTRVLEIQGGLDRLMALAHHQLQLHEAGGAGGAAAQPDSQPL